MAPEAVRLLGFWSVNEGYYSVMEDDWLVFRDDGTGWRAYLRPWHTTATLFRWVISGPDTLRVDAYRAVDLDESGGRDVVEVTELAQSAEASYRIEPGSRPLLDRPVSLLTIDLPFRQLDDAYAFVDHDEPQRDSLHKAGLQ